MTKELEKLLRIPKEKRTLGEKSADKLTTFVGSWTFMILLILYILIWVFLNVYAIVNQWDPYPFIVLNLSLSSIAALQAPIILMSQNREMQKDRARGMRDYYVDKKTMREIQDMQKDLDEIKKLIRSPNFQKKVRRKKK